MILFFDTETTTHNKGNPFDQRNRLVCCGWQTDSGDSGIWYNGEAREQLEALFSSADLLVAFNAKFDLHWLRNIGIEVSGRVYCVQVAEFFLNRQGPKYPSLDGTAASYGIPGKIDRVKTEYWDRGIYTEDIPRPILSEYCLQDIEATKQIYYKQQERVQPHNKTLLSLEMQDLLTLEDIEWNGLYFNPSIVKAKEQELASEISSLQTELGVYHNVPCFNWSSPAHISALLFGGTIVEERRIPVGVYKTGAKVGQPRFQIEKVEHKLARMYTPVKGSETAKAGVWSVDEDNLLKIKGGNKKLITAILRSKELGKLQSTYVGGLLEKHQEMNWPENYIHGQYNQVVAATGRLSSSAPNMQNMTEAVLDMFETRFQ